MQIFVDADACPVVDIIEKIAEKYNIKTTLLCDTNHVLYSDYSEVIVVGADDHSGGAQTDLGLAGGVSIGRAIGQEAGVYQINGLLCGSNGGLVGSPAAVQAQLLDAVLAQVTDQVIVEVEVGISAVQRQSLVAVGLQGLAGGQELSPGSGSLGDVAGIENILVVEHAADLGLLHDGVQIARETAEWLASRYHMWDESYPIGVHHGSLSKENRMETEDAFKAQELKGLICTSSLELGIDIGSADLVIQYNSPRQVARMTQRAGRAGHRIGGKIRAEILATAPDEVLEGMVVARRCEAKIMEYTAGRPNPLSVLANQLVAMTMAGGIEPDKAFTLVKRSYPFRDLTRKDFDDTVEQLKSIKLLLDYEGVLRRSRKGMNYFYENISMIPDEKTYLVRDIGSRAVIGTLDESFVATLEGDLALFIAKGRTWRVVEQREDELLVEEARTVGNVPAWEGSDIPVPFEVAMEVGRLRRIRNFDKYPGDAEAVKRAKDYLDEQTEKWTVPTDDTVTIEIGDRLAIINCCFGSRVNETLSKIISALITARIGESIGISTDAYRIILELPRNIDRRVIRDTFLSIKPGTVEALSRLTIQNSSHLKWRFMNIAKKFGIIEKGADRRYINYSKLFDLHRDTPAFNDAVSMVLWEDLDMQNTELVVKMIAEKKIRIVEQNVSHIGLEGITRSKELMQPARADHAILAAMKKRLDDEVLYATCLSCKNQRRVRVGDAPKKFVCPQCGGYMVALLKGYERDSMKDFGKPGRDQQAVNTDKRIVKNANLVNSYGGLSAIVLAGRGIGPEVAARILMKMHVGEDDLLRDIMAAEVNYAKTKRFWD